MTIANSNDSGAGGTVEELSSEAIEPIAFLARSEHRIRVLSLLDDEACTRERISEEMGVTRVTLSRILGDLEDREWITRNYPEDTYTLTSFGALVYRDFSRLLGTVSVGTEFPDVVTRLPTEWFDFDFQCLAEGELVADDGADPMSAARVVGNAVQNASSRHALLGTFLSLPFYTFEESIRAGDEPDGAVVFDSAVAETMLGDSNLRNRWQKIEAMADTTVYYRIDERIPCGIALIDGETVFLTVERDESNGFDVIRTTHPDVVEWAERTIGERRAAARPLRSFVDD